MESTKRSQENVTVNSNNAKRKKISIVTTFEDLPNEFMYEVFEYLDFHHAFRAFYYLNQRFQHLFDYLNLPIKINISSISKSAYDSYLKYIIEPHADRIHVLRIANPFAGDMCLSLFPLMPNFTQLTTFILDEIESYYLQQVLDHLFSLPLLSSLAIKSSDHTREQNDIYQKIFRLPHLKYCQLSIETRRYVRPLSIATSNFSPIEHLVINNRTLSNQLESLLSYVPQLQRLSLGCFDRRGFHDLSTRSMILNQLKTVSLTIGSLNFSDFERIIINYFQQVECLHLIVNTRSFYYAPNGYLNADQWKQLISTHMMKLRIFDLRHEVRSWDTIYNRTTFEDNINKFNSSFWIDRQWFFDHQCYSTMSFTIVIFYSINPYRGKSYKLCEESKQNIGPSSLQISDISIYSPKAIEQFIGYFPNATDLTFYKTFTKLDNSIFMDLNRIIPLNQLTRLNLNYHRFSLEQILQLLSCTLNIQTLIFDCKLSSEQDLTWIAQNEMFQLVSKRNVVTNLTITKECTLEKVQIFVALFPRVQFLTINLFKEYLETITRFLLSKFNDCTRNLSSIYFSKQRREFIDILTNLLQSEDLLNNYTIKLIDRKLHLWW